MTKFESSQSVRLRNLQPFYWPQKSNLLGGTIRLGLAETVTVYIMFTSWINLGLHESTVGRWTCLCVGFRLAILFLKTYPLAVHLCGQYLESKYCLCWSTGYCRPPKFIPIFGTYAKDLSRSVISFHRVGGEISLKLFFYQSTVFVRSGSWVNIGLIW